MDAAVVCPWHVKSRCDPRPPLVWWLALPAKRQLCSPVTVGKFKSPCFAICPPCMQDGSQVDVDLKKLGAPEDAAEAHATIFYNTANE